MYILFINLGDKCDFFFLLNLIIIVTKKNYPTHELGWVELDLCDGLGLVGLNF